MKDFTAIIILIIVIAGSLYLIDWLVGLGNLFFGVGAIVVIGLFFLWLTKNM